MILFIITNLVYVTMLTITIPTLRSFAGGMNILDMMPGGYNHEYVNSLMKTLGERGRHIYLCNQLPLDLVYPGLFGISSCLVLAYFFNKLNGFKGPVFYLCLIPLLSGFFDYCENAGIIRILRTYPDNSEFLTKVTSIFSVLKSSCTTIYFTILLITIIVFAIKKIKDKKRTGQTNL